jgi:hypothetical protein
LIWWGSGYEPNGINNYVFAVSRIADVGANNNTAGVGLEGVMTWKVCECCNGDMATSSKLSNETRFVAICGMCGYAWVVYRRKK